MRFDHELIKRIADGVVPYFVKNEARMFLMNYVEHLIINEDIKIDKHQLSKLQQKDAYLKQQINMAKTICESRLSDAIISARNSRGAEIALRFQHDWKVVDHSESKVEVAEGGLAAMIAKQQKEDEDE